MRTAHVRSLIAAALVAAVVVPEVAAAPVTVPAPGSVQFRRAAWSRPTNRAWNAGAEVAQRRAYDNAIKNGKTPQAAMALSNAMAAAAPFALAAAEEEKGNRAMILNLGAAALGALGIVATATGVGAAVGVPLMLGAASIAAGVGAQICVSTSCGVTVKADPNNPDNPQLDGSDVAAMGQGAPASKDWNGFVYSGSVSPGRGGERLDETFSHYGYYRTFPCKSGAAYNNGNTFFACFFMPMHETGNGYASIGLPNGEMFQYFGTGIVMPPGRLKQSGEQANFYFDGYGSGREKTPKQWPGLMVSSESWQGVENVVQTQYVPTAAANVTGSVSGAITTKAAAEPMSPQAIAALANEIAKRVAANGLPEAYDAASPATPADAAQWQERNPQRVPSVANAYSPITADGSLPKPTTEANPAADPIDVNVVNQPAPGTNTGTGANTGTNDGTQKTREEADEELPDDPGLVGDVLKPVKDFVAGPLKPWLAPNITLPGGQCPWSEFDLGKAWDGDGGVRTVATNSKDVFCGTVDDWTPTIQQILSIIYTFMVPLIIFRRS